MITAAEILALYTHAVCSRPVDVNLRRLAATALGVDASAAVGPLSHADQQRAIRGWADQLEMLRLMGVALLVEPAAPVLEARE